MNRRWSLVVTLILAGCASDRSGDAPPSEPSPDREAAPPAAAEVAPAAEPEAPEPPQAARWMAREGWQEQAPSSSMRTAQYLLPRADGVEDDTFVIVYFFGEGGGGTVEANLDRWRGQFGAVSEPEVLEVEEPADGVHLTVLDMTGDWSSQAMPGQGEVEDRVDQRMIAAVLEAPGGPWFVKVLGPSGTVGKWETSVRRFLHGAARFRAPD